jgi:threonylcarbamoyladenosine tRNA methylthiotransferase MtaB
MSVDIVTFGCRLNTTESEVMLRAAAAAGLQETIVFNTCAVTAEAVRQARQAIRKAKRERPGARVIVTGCAAQTEPHTFAEMPEVDRVVGNDQKLDVESWSDSPRAPGSSFGVAAEQKIAVNDIMAVKETALHLIDGMERRVRAFVQVQNGCDHRCTFCIIPYGRGNSRSVPMGEVVAQVRRLVENGYREMVLTGVDLTSYGGNLPGEPKLGLLSSIDSVEADPDLLDALAGEPRLMPHLHLSLQAGDDLILKRMKRRHLRGDAIAFCDQVRRLRPDVVFGADMIAGFPTETEAMFTRSLGLVDECGLTHLHVFPFSSREGTPAACMPQVGREIAKQRARRLRQKGEAALLNYLGGELGRTRRVLVEAGGIGRTEQFTPVCLRGPTQPGAFIEVRIAGHDGRRLLAA